MSDELRQRLLLMDTLKPYVWRLKLTEDEYEELKSYVEGNTGSVDKDSAILAIIYIAEWYKREYDGNVSNPLKNVTAESLWKASELDTETYVYNKIGGTHRWLESIYVLGGLPMNFMLQRNDTKLLKLLCRIYKGDNASLEDNKNVGINQAIAFQESMRQEASLYQFLKTLLLGNAKEVYAEEDLNNKQSLANRFIKAVQAAYDEVMQEKFRLEWIVVNNPASPYMRRMIRLWLRPEEMGGFHQCLKFERAGMWHIPNLIKQRKLLVSLQFKKGTSIVGDDETRRTILTFENTGQDDTGFEATGSVPWAILRAMPTEPFDRINVIITDDTGKEYVVQHFDCKMNYLQLWAIQNEGWHWSSIKRNQSETAVVYSKELRIDSGEFISKPFYDRTNGLTELWNFAFISDHVDLLRGEKKLATLWNRDGYIRFAPELYTSVLRYNGGKVKYVFNEDPEIYLEPETEEWYPVVFRRSDIKACHFATQNTINTEPDSVEIQKIEFKSFSASDNVRFGEWTEENKPEYGRIKLRLTIKGEMKIYPALYLPSMFEQGKDVPVYRDFEKSELLFVDEKSEVIHTPVDVRQDKNHLNPTIPLKVLNKEEEYVELDAYLPTLIKEVYLDGRIVKYLNDGERFVLPYLLKDRVVIHDFNREGYSEYECHNVGVMAYRGSVDQWRNDIPLNTKDDALSMPSYIHLVYGMTKNTGDVNMVYWDYSEERPPEEVGAKSKDMANYSILFQDMRQTNNNLDCVLPKQSNELSDDDWDSVWDDDQNMEKDTKEQDATLLRCFDVATMYKTYYFIFNPLFNMTEESFINGICKPVKRRNNNSLSEEDVQNLMRCAAEHGFDWMKISTKI